ncbi:MAG: hypothetical protein WC718_17210, partial [Phycisphaerales bacterium]
ALSEVLEDAMQGFGSSRAPLSGVSGPTELYASLRALLGERTWRQVAPSIAGMMEMRREPVLLLSPTTIVIK